MPHLVPRLYHANHANLPPYLYTLGAWFVILVALLGATAVLLFLLAQIRTYWGQLFPDQTGEGNRPAGRPNFFQRWFSGYTSDYLQHLTYRHRNFDVKGLSTQNIYTLGLEQVFVELAIAPRTLDMQSADPIRLPTALRGSYPVWYFLQSEALENQNLAIIGPPGSGKTTLLKHMALTLASGRRAIREANAPDKLPILLFLRDHADSIVASHQSLEEFSIEDNPATLTQYTLVHAVHEHLLRTQGPRPPISLSTNLPNSGRLGQGLNNIDLETDFFAQRLNRGECLILLDGLDEVAHEETRQAVVAWVENQVIAYPQNRFVVTSRPHGYRSNPIAGFMLLEVQSFTNTQINRFVHNWYHANEVMSSQKDDPGVAMIAREDAEDLLRRLRSAPTLTALAVNPLLLTMIATIHRYRSSLPGRRVELYAEVSEVFLGKRQAARGLEDRLTPMQKQRVLQPLAFHLMLNQMNAIGVEEATAVIADTLQLVAGVTGAGVTGTGVQRAFLDYIEDRSGLLIEREQGEYSFVHHAFQEYLAARHIAETGHVEVLTTRIHDSWWYETCRLYSAQADATPIIAACLAEDPPPIAALTLAIECNEEAREVDVELRKHLQAVLDEGVEDPDPNRRRLVGETLLALRLRRLVRVEDHTHIDPTYITHAEYQLFLDEMRGQGSYHQPDHWLQHTFPTGKGHTPIVGMRPSDAVAFCAWLTEREPDRQWRYRLPEAGELARYGLRISGWDSDALGCWVSVKLEQAQSQDDGQRKQPDMRFEGEEISVYMTESILQESRRADLSFGYPLPVDLERARDLARALNLDLDLAVNRALALTFSFDRALERALNLDHAIALALDLALDRTLDLDLILDLDLSRSLNINLIRALTLNQENQHEMEILKLLRWYLRYMTLVIAGLFQEALQRTQSSRSRWTSAGYGEEQLQTAVDDYLRLYTMLVMLEERIEGKLPAFEGIRIVKDRVQGWQREWLGTS
ncbi:MAG: NACHT domain-containing protein [Chloroflexota bacterium]